MCQCASISITLADEEGDHEEGDDDEEYDEGVEGAWCLHAIDSFDARWYLGVM